MWCITFEACCHLIIKLFCLKSQCWALHSLFEHTCCTHSWPALFAGLLPPQPRPANTWFVHAWFPNTNTMLRNIKGIDIMQSTGHNFKLYVVDSVSFSLKCFSSSNLSLFRDAECSQQDLLSPWGSMHLMLGKFVELIQVLRRWDFGQGCLARMNPLVQWGKDN